MTPRDLLLQLRDVHLPPETAAAPTADFILWPLLIFAGLVILVAAIAFWRGRIWRREAKSELAKVSADADPVRQLKGLLDLSIRVARVSGRAAQLPDAAYRRPETISPADLEGLRGHIAGEIRR
jgi:hypothetical protein